VTPELAGKIVKHMILPMFERKNQARVQKHSGSVYNELSLSALLTKELDVIGIKVHDLHEQLEKSLYK
jgi:glycine/serine hydroxymethyltransferase